METPPTSWERPKQAKRQRTIATTRTSGVVHLLLEQGGSIATLLGVMALGIALAYVGYRRSFAALPPKRWRLLFGLRAAAIVVVSILLFRPLLRIERDLVDRRTVVLALDTSTSMATADDATRIPRIEQARARIRDWTGKLAERFDVKLVAFDDRATLLDGPDALTSLQAEGPATSLVRGLSTASRVAPAKSVEAVILFSDGIHNAAGDPVATATRSGLTIHTIGVGNSLKDSPSYRDLRIASLECPETMPQGNRTRVLARLAQTGMPGTVVPVTLTQDGTTLETKSVTLPISADPVEVAFEFVPTALGRHTFAVQAAEQPGEAILPNNRRQAVAQVVESKIKVLYLEGTLRAEYGAIVQRFLSKDPDIEFASLVQTRPNVFQKRSNIDGLTLDAIPSDPETLNTFDVIILGDLDSTYFKPPALERLVERVKTGAGLIVLGGYHSLGPGGYGGSALDAILPVDPGSRDMGQLTDPFLPILTPDGRAHSIFANIAGFFPTADAPAQQADMPLLGGCTKVGPARPGATVLATVPGTNPPMPLLAVQPAGKGRVAVFGADTTRNWHQVLRALNEDSPFLRFWGQIVRWSASRDNDMKPGAQVKARTDRAYYDPDAPVAITATLRDAQGEGSDKATVKAAMTVKAVNPSESAPQPIELFPVTGAPGQYAATWSPPGAGTFTIDVTATLDGQALTAEPIEVEVGRANLEFDRLDLDADLLTRIAGAAHGQYRHIAAADSLLDRLDRTERMRHLSLETPLYRPGPFWFLLVGLLAAEWFLRRRSQLR
jgi:uncharacterized membrane protein